MFIFSEFSFDLMAKCWSEVQQRPSLPEILHSLLNLMDEK